MDVVNKRGVPYRVPLLFYRAQTVSWRVECDLSAGKVFEVSRGSKNEDRYADVMWLENLELN